MKAEIINIGDELLIGQVVNTNASWLGEQLNLNGIQVSKTIAIPDKKEAILDALAAISKQTGLVMISGGLGPTRDDITKLTLCEYFETKLVMHQPTLSNIEERFRQRGYRLTELNRKQAEIPVSCIPIKNNNGTAPGMWFEKEGVIFVSMPGVPFELKPMVTGFIIPMIKERFSLPVIIHKTILTHGTGESRIAEIIEEWENNLPDDIRIAYLPQPGLVRLRLTATGNERKAVDDLLETKIDELLRIIPEYVFGFDNDTLEEIVGKLLRDLGKTLSTAESCTGGYIAHLITSIPGSSEYFTGSVVAYSNEIKENVLKVSKETMVKYGAVSKETVTQMASGIRDYFDTDYSIAVSGIAGPDGGSTEKPVGTTWIAVATPDQVITRKYLLGDHRGRNIRIAALAALNMLRKQLLSNH